ncbi:MAG: PfkB family carbohydrate kinase [Spirochaetes bacterium]|nr:PfkB family carbohydrate kinase [Spirochaetota bacterium]
MSVLGIGGVVTDRIMVIPDMPHWDQVCYVKDFSIQQGGMIGTAMAAVARLGEKAEFIGGIGDDKGGEYILKQFHNNNVICDRIKIFSNETSAFSECLVHQKTGERTIIHYKGVQNKDQLFLEKVDLTGVQYLHLDGYWLDTAIHTARTAKKQKIKISLDPSSKLIDDHRTKELLSLTDYFIPSYHFATRFTGQTDPEKIITHLARTGMNTIILTYGKNGSYLYQDQEFSHIPSFQVKIKDTTGAGDTFHGAFLVGLMKKLSIKDSVIFANAAAALKCKTMGGQQGIPTFQQTIAFLNDQGIHLFKV